MHLINYPWATIRYSNNVPSNDDDKTIDIVVGCVFIGTDAADAVDVTVIRKRNGQ